MILLTMFHLLFIFFLIKIHLTLHLKHPPSISEVCEVTLKRLTCTGTGTHSLRGEMYLIRKRTRRGKVCVCSLKESTLALNSPALSPSLCCLFLHLCTFPQGHRTGHICIPLLRKSNDHQPVNNAGAVPARVAVGRVLSGSIGKSAEKIRVVNE